MPEPIFSNPLYTIHPGMSLTAYATELVTDYFLWVGESHVTSKNLSGTNWNYDAENKTLTLNNYSYSGRGYGDNNAAAIYYKGGETLKIVINGTCSLTSTGNGTHSYGIFAATNCSLEFSGSGSLAVTGCQSSFDNVGIMAGMNVTIGGGAVSAIGGTSETGSTSSYGICSYAGTIQIGNNVRYVEAKGYNSAIYALRQSVKNEIPGTGWTNIAGTQGKAYIDVSTEGQKLDDYKKVQFPAAPTTYSTVSIANADHTIGDGKDAVLTVKGDPDTRTYDNFDGVEMDGKAVSADNYSKEKGSLVLTLKASYLDTLSAGDHKVTIKFNDGGTATAALKVTAATTPTAAPTTAPTPTPKPVPKTGDTGNPSLWLLIALLGVSLLGITVKQYSGK